MNTKKEHIAYLKSKGTFCIDCNTIIFSEEEKEILKKYGHWFKALCDGTLAPCTEMQENFIKVYNAEQEPFSIEEKAWFKYLGRKKIEEKLGDRLNIQYHPEDDSFYSRDMAKKLRGMMYNEMHKNHKS